jgi:thiosulfate dehydrogenase [quinone] large subunit
MNNHRQVGYALLRVTFGMIFLTTGIVKFTMGVGAFAAAVQPSFAGKLPLFLVSPFLYLLPFAEVTVGALLILGLFTRLALVLAGLLLMALTFGKTAVSDSATVAGNLSYILIAFVLLWLSDHNGYSIDRLRRGRLMDNL